MGTKGIFIRTALVLALAAISARAVDVKGVDVPDAVRVGE